jgi:adenine-specific DNA-methyltransferase
MQQQDSQARLKGLFRELFQLDVADLDFGLYRLFRLKRAEVEAFLDKQLPAEIARAFEAAAGAERETLQKRVDDLAERARGSVADDAILPSGEPNPIHAKAKAVKEYADARTRLQAIEASEAQRAEVFNLLYAFFSRYYDEGDFIPRRFFGARTSYAVPYNGEEVFFHWANKDQYYVKSGEAFRDYSFTVATVSGSYRVRFKLAEATAPKDNTKGDTRFFFPLAKEATFEETTRTFTVPFHYRLPTEGEATKYGKNSKAQEVILDEAAPRILKSITEDFMRGALSAPSPSGSEAEGEEPPTLLRRRLTHFTKKNTTDYFVHRNLGAFLRQELEFFVRDQVVHEADLEGDFEAKRRTIRVFRKLADTVTTFLAQIEDAQKRLFEKKKFVLRTDYLVPIQHVPRALWPDILGSKTQLAEWKTLYALEPKSDLFNIKGQINERVLEQHPTLVVDTRHFSPAFTLRLLETIEDLDEQVDGVLVHSENFQALSLMQVRYGGQLQCIYIDPPYNTDASPIDYKNGYKASSWMSLLSDRIGHSRPMLAGDGVFIAAIDDEQQRELNFILSATFNGRLLGTICVRANPSGRPTKSGYSVSHEYLLFAGQTDRSGIGRLPPTEEQQSRFTQRDALGQFEWRNLRREGSNSDRSARRALYYPIYIRGTSIRVPRMAWHDQREEWQVQEKPEVGEHVVWPDNDDGVQKTWRWEWKTVMSSLRDLSVRADRSGKDYVYYKRRPHEEGVVSVSSWFDAKYSATEHGTALLKALFGRSPFSYPKSIHAVIDAIYIGGASLPTAAVLDYFAGSGTTGHAVINLNRADGGRRKFVLVEVGDYFDTVLVPRLKKVMFTPEWKDGKPGRLATKEEAERTPRLVKVLRLESYEDALHNTFSDVAIAQLADREKAYKNAVGDDDYRIRYLVTLPLEASDSMLNLAKLEHPFDYGLEVLTDYGPKIETVDLVETFNWLYGLRVHRLLTWVNKKDKAGKEKDGRLYRVVFGSDREGKKRVLVVWRDMTSLDATVERSFLEAQAKEVGSFDEQWINGDTAAKNFASLDGLFRRLMEEGER